MVCGNTGNPIFLRHKVESNFSFLGKWYGRKHDPTFLYSYTFFRPIHGSCTFRQSDAKISGADLVRSIFQCHPDLHGAELARNENASLRGQLVEGNSLPLPFGRYRRKYRDLVFVIRIEEHLIDVADQGGVRGDFGRLSEVFEVTDQLAESGVVE